MTSVPNKTEVVIRGLATVSVESNFSPTPFYYMMELLKQGSMNLTVNWIGH